MRGSSIKRESPFTIVPLFFFLCSRETRKSNVWLPRRTAGRARARSCAASANEGIECSKPAFIGLEKNIHLKKFSGFDENKMDYQQTLKQIFDGSKSQRKRKVELDKKKKI